MPSAVIVLFALVFSPLIGLDAERPRTCPSCGVYSGPNSHLMQDALFAEVDVWPEFNPATCELEVAAYRFVHLSRRACRDEQAYRARVPGSVPDRH